MMQLIVIVTGIPSQWMLTMTATRKKNLSSSQELRLA
jgi:hypothetical protein